MYFQIIIIMFLFTKVRSAPLGRAEEIERVMSVIEGIRQVASKILDILKTYPNEFTQINSTLSDLVAKASSDLIVLFTILFWTGTLALNTLPSFEDSISHYIHHSLAPHKLYLLTCVYGLLLGAAGTSVYNILDALASSAKWGLLAGSAKWGLLATSFFLIFRVLF